MNEQCNHPFYRQAMKETIGKIKGNVNEYKTQVKGIEM